MAKKLTSKSEYNFNEYPRSLSRQNPFPLDYDSLFFSLGEENSSDLSTARGYARLSPVAYVGQTLAVVDDARGIVAFYQIKNTLGTLEEVGQKLIGITDTENDNAGWTGAKIKAWVINYIEENGGTGGGSYVAPTMSFSGIGTRYVETQSTYSLPSFTLTVSDPGSIRSDIEMHIILNGTQDFSYTLPKAEILQTNTIAIDNFSTSGGTQLDITNLVASADSNSYTFSASATDSKNNAVSASGSFRVLGAYYMYFGVNTSPSLTNSTLPSIADLNTAGIVLSNNKTTNITLTTTANSYIWICIPTNCTIKKISMGGFDVTSDFTDNASLVSGVNSHTGVSLCDYNCYRSNLQAANTISLTIEIN